MENKQLLFTGKLSIDFNGEDEDILYLDEEPIAEVLEELCNKYCTVSYYTSDEELTLEEAQEEFIKKLYGVVEATYNVRYSETTGYLWTDEEFKVGGHDLLEELRTHKEKYLILIVEVDSNKETIRSEINSYKRLISYSKSFEDAARNLKLTREEVFEMCNNGEISAKIKNLENQLKS